MSKHHHYTTKITWTGNTGEGTVDATTYERSHILSIENKADIACSSVTPFRGDGTKHNTEDVVVLAIKLPYAVVFSYSR